MRVMFNRGFYGNKTIDVDQLVSRNNFRLNQVRQKGKYVQYKVKPSISNDYSALCILETLKKEKSL